MTEETYCDGCKRFSRGPVCPYCDTDRMPSVQDNLVSEMVKQIEDEIRASHPGMTDEQIKELHKNGCSKCGTVPGKLRGVDVPTPAFVYCPYIPMTFYDLRPWYKGMWSWTWWRTKWDYCRLVIWWRRRRLMKRYAVKSVDPTLYRTININKDLP